MLKAYRSNHWSCSWVADVIRGEAKPRALTSVQWDTWHTKLKVFNPIRYWLAEEGLAILQDVANFPYDVFYTVKCYVKNRFITKTHVLDTKLEKGVWHDLDTRLLHGMFESLVDFVENETTVNNLILETSLVIDREYYPGIDEEFIGQPTSQALDALEALDLYVWWKYIRPAREEDPMDYDSYFATKRSEHSDEEMQLYSEGIYHFSSAFDEKWDEEDTEMMIRLVKLRHSLWT